jgi:hypothetical protein
MGNSAITEDDKAIALYMLASICDHFADVMEAYGENEELKLGIKLDECCQAIQDGSAFIHKLLE